MTLDDKAYAMFVNAPWVWFGARELQDHLGICGWRTRVSTARRRGLNIKNRIVLTPEGRKLSFYQFQPRTNADGQGQTSLFSRPESVPHRERQGDLGCR